MPENFVREELETLNIRVQGVMQLCSGRRNQDPTKDLHPTSQFIVSMAWDHKVSSVRSRTEIYSLRAMTESYVAPKDPLQGKRCQSFGKTQRN